jgi:hypothetical protein
MRILLNNYFISLELSYIRRGDFSLRFDCHLEAKPMELKILR